MPIGALSVLQTPSEALGPEMRHQLRTQLYLVLVIRVRSQAIEKASQQHTYDLIASLWQGMADACVKQNPTSRTRIIFDMNCISDLAVYVRQLGLPKAACSGDPAWRSKAIGTSRPKR